MSAPAATRDNVAIVEFNPRTIGGITLAPMPAWKRAFDLTIAIGLLLFLSPLLVLIALAIVLESRGAPIYRQARVGHGGRVFTVWKFRTMYVGADRLLAKLEHLNEAQGHIFKIKDDPRRTKVGRFLRKTSLDELPQLWNIIRGDMSCVGPRPPTTYEVAKYEEHEMGRLAAVPGVTGLWQVTKRGDHNFADMVQLDIDYARRLSPMLDLTILLKTVPTIVSGRGSY